MEGLPQSANLQPHHRPTDQNVLVANRTIKLLKKLGEGAFGEIFIGLSIQTGLEVAVKR
jgi:serine/threonine protein kinase